MEKSKKKNKETRSNISFIKNGRKKQELFCMCYSLKTLAQNIYNNLQITSNTGMCNTPNVFPEWSYLQHHHYRQPLSPMRRKKV